MRREPSRHLTQGGFMNFTSRAASYNLRSPNLLIDFTVASSFHIPDPIRSICIMLTPGVKAAKSAPRRPELQ
jgi:hypothetical protein